MRLDMTEYLEKHAVSRAIQRRLENKLAEAILSQKLLPGDTARTREPIEA